MVFYLLNTENVINSSQLLGGLLDEMVTNTGETLKQISDRMPVMLIFLRHFGCTFCREALADIAKKRNEIREKGIEVVFVHMSNSDTAEKYFKRYNLGGSIHISDPECKFYSSFGLVKGNFNQLFGLKNWIRGFNAGVVNMHGIGGQIGDGFQMPGVFIIQDGSVREQYIHKLASDRPNYVQLLECCTV